MIIQMIDYYIDQYKEDGFTSQANSLIKVRGKVLHNKKLNSSDIALLQDHNIQV